MPERDAAAGAGLVGAGHAELVGFLAQRLDDVRAGADVPRVVVLTAASGAGKSRVVRELYRRLRLDPALQPRNDDGEGYWPDLPESLERATRGGAGFPGRKVIGPPVQGFERPPGTLPGFFWLPVRCDQAPDGSMVPALELMWPSLQAHARFLAAAWRAAASTGEKARQWAHDKGLTEAQTLAKEGGLEALSAGLDALNVAAPGAGWALGKTASAVRLARERRRVRVDVATGGTLDPGIRSAEEVHRQLLRLVHQQLPLVVVVEDLHLMDAELADLLALLAVPVADKPVLVIGTAWPEGEDRPVYAGWLDDLRSTGDPLVEVVGGMHGHRDFPELTLDDRVAVVRAFAPATDVETLQRVARRWMNPYALLLAVTSRPMRRHIVDDRLDVDDAELARIPADVEGLYRDRWLELDDGVRDALMLASGAVPAPGDDAALWPFVADVVAAAAGRAGLLDDAEGLASSLGRAVDPFAWARLLDVDLDLCEFREWILARIARDNFDREFGDATTFTDAVADVVAQRIDARRGDHLWVEADDELGLALCRWLLALEPERTDVVSSVAALSLAVRAADSWRYADAIDLMTVPDRIASLPPDHPESLTARSYLASWLGESGRVGEAAATLEVLLAEQVRVRGPVHPNTLRDRGNLAFWLGESGRVGEAVAQFRVLLADLMHVLGPDHPDTLTARSNLAFWLGQAGRAGEAVAALELLLADRLRVLGPDHPDTLKTRNNLAFWLGESGRAGDAVAAFELLLADRLRVLGPDHPDTLTARNNLAFWLGESGRVGEAVAQFEVLLPALSRVLGPDHPHTLSTRNNLATLLGESGLAGDAVAQLKALLADRIRVLGPDHPNTMRTRGNLAFWLGESGRAGEAVAAFQVLLADQLRVLGPDHPDTLTTRGNLAFWLGESGRVEEAVSAFEVLLADRVRVLGPDHPATVTTRENLARFRAQLDDPGPPAAGPGPSDGQPAGGQP